MAGESNRRHSKSGIAIHDKLRQSLAAAFDYAKEQPDTRWMERLWAAKSAQEYVDVMKEMMAEGRRRHPAPEDLKNILAKENYETLKPHMSETSRLGFLSNPDFETVPLPDDVRVNIPGSYSRSQDKVEILASMIPPEGHERDIKDGTIPHEFGHVGAEYTGTDGADFAPRGLNQWSDSNLERVTRAQTVDPERREEDISFYEEYNPNGFVTRSDIMNRANALNKGSQEYRESLVGGPLKYDEDGFDFEPGQTRGLRRDPDYETPEHMQNRKFIGLMGLNTETEREKFERFADYFGDY